MSPYLKNVFKNSPFITDFLEQEEIQVKGFIVIICKISKSSWKRYDQKEVGINEKECTNYLKVSFKLCIAQLHQMVA